MGFSKGAVFDFFALTPSDPSLELCNFFTSGTLGKMERESGEAGDAGEILVESEHAGAMLQRNCGDERIDRGQAHAFGAGEPENRRSFPIGSEAAGFEHFPLGKIVFDAADIPRQALKDFSNHHACQRERFGVTDHPAKLMARAPRCGAEKIDPYRAI